MISREFKSLVVQLESLDAATAAWLVDFCGHLQHAIWQAYGDEIEAYWTATEPEQPVTGPLSPITPRKRR